MTSESERRRDVRRVLVVDDHEDLADTLCGLLRQLGFHAVAVYNGASALCTAATYLPDLVVLDLKLPDMQGEEVCRLLRAEDVHRGLHVIALTGRPTIAQANAACFDHYLQKPAGAADILDVIRAADSRTTGSTPS